MNFYRMGKSGVVGTSWKIVKEGKAGCCPRNWKQFIMACAQGADGGRSRDELGMSIEDWGKGIPGKGNSSGKEVRMSETQKVSVVYFSARGKLTKFKWLGISVG